MDVAPGALVLQTLWTNLFTSSLGFARSLGLQLPGGQRREWIKPIMFSGGIGSMEAKHVGKELPEPGKSNLSLHLTGFLSA